ncbi:hypothetical protein AKJ16_DCAP26100, partial [Drosera capensis]
TVISKLTTTVFTTVVKLQTFDLQSSFILNSNFPLSKEYPSSTHEQSPDFPSPPSTGYLQI